MRRIELLIDDSRKETENVEFTDDAGITDEEFIRWANDAQNRLQSGITQKNEKIFTKEFFFNTVARQERYTLPDDILYENKVSNVELSTNGNTDDYFPIDQATIKERNTISRGTPNYYIRLSGQILLNPVPDSAINKVRLLYINRINRLDKRRALIDSVTTLGTQITSLTLDTTQLIDKAALDREVRFSVVNEDGVTQMRRVKFTNIDDTTGVVTIDPAFNFKNDENEVETISAGDYLVGGGFSTNKSELPFSIERYLLAYMNWKAFKRDSSADSQEAQVELLAIEDDIIQSFSDVDDDIQGIPITSHRFIVDEEIV